MVAHAHSFKRTIPGEYETIIANCVYAYLTG
jgi:hypothetical protein